MPVALAHKRVGTRGYFLVLCHADRVLFMVDDATYQVAAKIALAGQKPMELVTPADSRVATVFYTFGDPLEGSAGIGGVDLAGRRDDGPVQPGQGEVSDIGVSADGKVIYGRRMNVSPSGVFLFRVEPAATGQPVRATQWLYRHEDCGTFVADPFNQYVGSGPALWSVDFAQQVTVFPGNVAGFATDRPLIFALAGDDLIILSYNTLRQVAAVKLPALGPTDAATPRSFNNHAYPTCVQYDAKDRLVFVCREDHVTSVKLDDLHLPDEPLLNLTVEGDTTPPVGVPASLALAGRGVSFQLLSGPAGLTLERDRLVWSPAADQVGLNTVVLSVRANDLQRRQTIRLDVRRPGIWLPFGPQNCSLSADGKWLLAMSSQQNHDLPDYGTRFAVVNLETRAVVADRVIPLIAAKAAIGGDFVYAAAQDADLFLVLSRKDLSEVRRIFTPARVRSMTPLGTKLIVTVLGPQETAYAVPEFVPQKPTEAAGAPAPIFAGDPEGPVRCGNGWYSRGILYDNAMEKVKLVVYPEQLAMMPAWLPNRSALVPDRARTPGSPWDTSLNLNSVSRPTGQTIGQVPGSHPVLLSDVPAVASLLPPDHRSDMAPNRPALPDRWSVVLTDVATMSRQQQIPLMQEPPLYPGNQVASSAAGITQLFAAPGVLAAVVRNQLFVLVPKQTEAANFPVPLHLTLSEPAIVVDPAKAVVTNVLAHGGKAPIRFALEPETPGITIDPASGKLTVDGLKLLPGLTEWLSGQMPHEASRVGGRATNGEEMLALYEKVAVAQYKQITGRAPEGLPMCIPVRVIAHDREQEATIIQTVALVAVPRAPVLKLLRERFGPHEAAVPPPATTRAAPDPAALQHEIEKLQRRVNELEAQNKRLQEQLQNRQKPGTTAK